MFADPNLAVSLLWMGVECGASLLAGSNGLVEGAKVAAGIGIAADVRTGA